jgi:hypothetical protein
MGRNVKKCTIYLYNIPENTIILEFTSIAWSYDSQGPVKGTIAVVVMRRDSENNNLICYQVLKAMRENAPQHIKDILSTRKYLGVAKDAQLDGTDGKEKILTKLNQRIGLIAAKMNSIQEAKIAHNMLVCQVATFSSICISMPLKECAFVDKQILKAYHYWLKFMPSDTKHNMFISEKRGGLGLHSFSREYIGALQRDLEVYNSNKESLPAHALVTSLEEATKQTLWMLNQEGFSKAFEIVNRVKQFHISGKRTMFYQDTFDQPYKEFFTVDHTHTMAKAISTTCALGFIL